MPEYAIGKHRARIKKPGSVVVHVSLPRRVYERLETMRAALQREIGADQHVTLASIVRRILYQHAALRNLARRHYRPEPDDDGNSLVREE